MAVLVIFDVDRVCFLVIFVLNGIGGLHKTVLRQTSHCRLVRQLFSYQLPWDRTTVAQLVDFEVMRQQDK